MCGICFVCSLSPPRPADLCPTVFDLNYINSNSFLPRRGPDVHRCTCRTQWWNLPAVFAGYVLHLRGSVTPQPLQHEDGDLLLWNGEIFGGIEVSEEENDTQVLLDRLVKCESEEEILATVQAIQGPWALIFWQAKQNRLWFGRDVFGRRSLLWHLPDEENGLFALSSVPIKPLDYEEIPSLGMFCLEPAQPSNDASFDTHKNAEGDSVNHTFILHVFPWEGAIWPGTDESLASDSSNIVAQKLGIGKNIGVKLHTDQKIPSWMPVVNSEIPEDGNFLVDVSSLAEDSNLLSVLREIEKKGKFDVLVKQFTDVLQNAVNKRVHNLPRSGQDSAIRTESYGMNNGRNTCVTDKVSVMSLNCQAQLMSKENSNHSGNRIIQNSNNCLKTQDVDSQVNCQENKKEYIVPDPEEDELQFQDTSIPKTQGTSKPDDFHDYQETASGKMTSLATDARKEPSENSGTLQPSASSIQKCQEKKIACTKSKGTEETESKTCTESSEDIVGDGSVGSKVRTQCVRPAYVAVLFSGGVDSTVLAALADRCLPEGESIDLINVAFEQKPANLHQGKKQRKGEVNTCESQATNTSNYNVPDRLTGYAALAELNPRRQWNFVEVNVTQEMLQEERSQRVRHLVYPLKTVLDDSIGCAVWFAARGQGVLGNGPNKGAQYTSTARVILCGMGADEQLAGYSRHRVRFKQESWSGLISEITMEIHRISARNLGRDDRVITDHGKESRFPFLDEEVVAFLAGLPIQHKADLRLARGVGEKLLLRLVALRLGLPTTASLPKRAIQFGSRIAKLEQSKEKGAQTCSRLTQD